MCYYNRVRRGVEILTRLNKIQKAMVETDIEALMVTNPYNLRYATNFTGTTGLAVITQEKGYFVTDFRYTEQAAAQASDYEIVKNVGSIYKEVGNIVKKDHISTLAIEFSSITLETFGIIEDLVAADFEDGTGLIEALREVKEPEEIEKIRQAIKIAEAAYEHILDWVKIGQTEIEVANELDFFMRGMGASGVSFDTIVASGVRSAMPHGVASDKKLANNELVTIDFGCYYEGYVSDMTRTFAFGDPGEELVNVYHIVQEANKRVHEAAGPNINGKDLDAVARDYITENGYGEAFGHTTGHGIGLEIHEEPSVAARNEELFVKNNVITNEPGIYLPGKGGVRIEDDMLVTATGSEKLMTLESNLIQL